MDGRAGTQSDSRRPGASADDGPVPPCNAVGDRVRLDKRTVAAVSVPEEESWVPVRGRVGKPRCVDSEGDGSARNRLGSVWTPSRVEDVHHRTTGRFVARDLERPPLRHLGRHDDVAPNRADLPGPPARHTKALLGECRRDESGYASSAAASENRAAVRGRLDQPGRATARRERAGTSRSGRLHDGWQITSVVVAARRDREGQGADGGRHSGETHTQEESASPFAPVVTRTRAGGYFVPYNRSPASPRPGRM